MSDNTFKNAKRDAQGRVLPGYGGRVPGSRNKLQAKFVEALAKDFEENGEGVIRIVRVENPAVYLKVIASILPKELLLTENVLEDVPDDELDAALETIRKIRCERADKAPDPEAKH